MNDLLQARTHVDDPMPRDVDWCLNGDLVACEFISLVPGIGATVDERYGNWGCVAVLSAAPQM